jgi:TRAP-type mannitol/chloroaromatic compound transport system permease large subunit
MLNGRAGYFGVRDPQAAFLSPPVAMSAFYLKGV